MTGLYVRVERGGRWQAVEVETLTEEEWRALEACSTPEKGWQWARRLAAWIHDEVPESMADLC